jgi:solute:Na+ symporter, SSS family
VIFGVSTLGCLLGTWLSAPEEDAVLMSFYKTVNPWGFWGPIREKVVREDPSFAPNHHFGRDALNVLIGIVWQLCLTALPIYIVLQNWTWVGCVAATLVVTSIFIKFNWYDKLEPASVPAISA